MAIVLKYGAPGQILQSGFASGVGSRKNKQKDDLLDIWQQQQQQAFAGQQASRDRGNRQDLQQQSQQFAAGQNQFNLDFRAKQELDDRAFRAGEGQLQRDFMAGQASNEDQRRFRQQQFFRLPPVPEHADPATRKKLTEQRNAMGELMGTNWDQNDPNTQKAWREAYDTYTTGVSALEESFSPADEHNRNLGYLDPKTGKVSPTQAEGSIPYDTKNKQPVIDNSDAQAAEMKRQEKAQSDAAKQQEKLQDAQQKKQQRQIEHARKIWSDAQAEGKSITPAEAMRKASEFDDALSSTAPTTPSPVTETYTDSEGNLRESSRRGTPVQQPPTTKEKLSAAAAAMAASNAPLMPAAPPPALVQTMKDNGAKDPARAAAMYQDYKSRQAPFSFPDPGVKAPIQAQNVGELEADLGPERKPLLGDLPQQDLTTEVPSQQTLGTAKKMGYVFVGSPQEAMRLPRGTKWVNSKGQTGRRP